MTAHIPFKYDFVGSFLRPEAVQNAKSLLKKGLISKEELTKVENTEIEKLIAKQKAAGYHESQMVSTEEHTGILISSGD